MLNFFKRDKNKKDINIEEVMEDKNIENRLRLQGKRRRQNKAYSAD